MTTLTTLSAQSIRQAIQRELPDLLSIRHDLHAHPELGYEEKRTSEVVQRELQKAGVEFKAGLAGGTGVLAHLPGAGERAVALRADMDALPIFEESKIPYASTCPGKMHACGHDGHTTMLIGAARVLARLSKEGGLPRPVTFVFQPAEEGGAGGQKMVQDGCLTGKVIGRPVERMFGLHGWPRMKLGEVGSRPGPMLAASDRFEILVTGRGAHAAQPHLSRDPVPAACAIVSALQTIASRNVDPFDSIVVSTTMLGAGTAFNVIPDGVKIGGTVRTLRKETQTMAIERMTTIAQSVAAAHACTAKLDYRVGYPVTRNDAGACETFFRTAEEAIGRERVVRVENPSMGGEDFSYYCEEVPSCFFLLGLLPQGQASMPDLHQATFNFNDDAMALGIEMFCRLATRSAW